MSATEQGTSRKRALPHPSSSSCPAAKQLRTAGPSLTARPTSPPLQQSDTADCREGLPQSPIDSTLSNASSCDTALPSPAHDAGPSDPFPRYSLGIPHLDALLPLRDGLDLLHAYFQGIGYIHNPVDRTLLLETFEEAERHGVDSIHPHRLACLLAALALGDLFSTCFVSTSSSSYRQSADTPSKRGRIWFGVASACLAGACSDIELLRNPTLDACSALYLMSTYLLCSNDDELFHHRAQGLTGLALVLAKSALIPSCVASAQTSSSETAQHDQACSATAPSAAPSSPTSSPTSPSQSLAPASKAVVDQDRLHCNRLLSDLIFHLRCQVLTFASPGTAGPTCPQNSSSLASFADVPTIQAIWTALGTPLYPSLDAFGNRYSPNIFHNWKLGLADLMHQVSCLTNLPITLDNLASQTGSPFMPATDSTGGINVDAEKVALPDHAQVVKLDERIRRYHASLPDFLLLHRQLPIEMAGKVDEDELAQIICQRHMACSMVHRMLMALHRPWFLSALACSSPSSQAKGTQPQHASADAETSSSSSSSEKDADTSRYRLPGTFERPVAPALASLSAVLRSATWQTETFASAAVCAPPQALVWWQFTNNALAAAIVQATALLRLSCPLAAQKSSESRPAGAMSLFHSQVRSDLDKNICSFQNVAKRCKLAAKALPFLQRVCSAIDLGYCKSNKPAAPSEALQSNPFASERSQSSSTTDSTSSTCNTSTTLDINSNNSISNSHLRTDPSRNSNSISHSHHVTTNNNSQSTATIQRSKCAQQTVPASLASFGKQPQASSGSSSGSGSRRASSGAGSELEAIFGPISRGLETPENAPSARAAVSAATKPMYHQTLHPIPVSSVGTRGDDEQSSQPSHSDAASSSSSAWPWTPRMGSPQAESRPEMPEAIKEQGTEKAAGKKSAEASDLVLQCIRFWQPSVLRVPQQTNLSKNS